MAVALLALFISLGGSAIAARHYLITRTSQIKPSVLNSLRGKAGPRGPTGAQGPAGAQGLAGPINLGALQYVIGPEVGVKPSTAGHATANCPAGYRIVSGGYKSNTPAMGEVFAEESFGEQGWTAMLYDAGVAEGHIQAVAYCAPAGTAISASRSVVHAHAQALIRAAEAAELAAKHK
jgi:hypothetical protein